MKRILYILLVSVWSLPGWAQSGIMWSSSGWVQSGDGQLNVIYIDLVNNRNTGDFFMGLSIKKQLARLDSASQSGETLSDKAFFYFLLRDYEKGVSLMEESTRLDPKQHQTTARTYFLTLHDYARALRHYDAFDALTPNFDDTDGIYPVSYHKGLCYRALGNHAEAVRQFSIGIDSLAKKHGTEWVNYKQYVSRAIEYLALQQPDKALLDLEQAAQNATSDSPLVLYYKGKAYLQQGRPTDAKRAFQDAQFFWQANRVKGITQPEDYNNPVTEQDIEAEIKR